MIAIHADKGRDNFTGNLAWPAICCDFRFVLTVSMQESVQTESMRCLCIAVDDVHGKSLYLVDVKIERIMKTGNFSKAM